MLFQHGGHAGLITAATGLVRLDHAFFKAQRDQNLVRFFLRAALFDFRLMFSYDDCVRKWLPCSIWIQPLPKRGFHQCGRYRRHWFGVEIGYRAPSLCTRVAQ